MARSNNEQRNIDINFNTNAQQTSAQVDNLKSSINSVTQATDKQSASVNNLTNEITANGGAMSILDTITDGYATTVKDAVEATGLFKEGTSATTLAQKAYSAVVGTSTGALKAFRIALAATGIGAIVVLLGLLITNWERLTGALNNAEKAQKSVNDAMKTGTINASAEANQLMTLIKIAKDETASKTARLNAIKAINAISPEYLGNITLETINTEAATVAIKNYINALNQKMKVQALEKAIQKTYDDELAASEKDASDYLKWYDYALNGVYDIDKAARKRQAEDIKSANDTRIALNNKLEKVLKDSPEQIYQENKKANAKIVNSAKDNSAERKRIEEERIAFFKKIDIEYTNWLKTNGSVSPTQGMINQSKINIASLEELKRLELASLKKQTGQTEDELRIREIKLEEYYDFKIEKERNSLGNLENIVKAEKNLMQEFSKVDSKSAYSDDFTNFSKNVKDFIDNLKDSNLKEYYSEAFNVENIEKIESIVDKYKGKTINQFELISIDKEGIDESAKYIQGLNEVFNLFSKERDSDMRNLYRNTLEVNLEILKGEEDHAISTLELLNATESEKQKVRDGFAQRRIDMENETASALLEIDEVRFKQQVTALNSYGDLLGATAGLMGEHTAGYKSLAIAQTTIDTYTSAMAAYKGMVQSIPGPVGIAAGAAAAAASVITGISNVKKILAVKTPGGGSSSVSASAPSATATPNVSFVSSSENQITNGVTNAMSNTSNQPMRAYVVASDVTTAQQLERNTIDSNSL